MPGNKKKAVLGMGMSVETADTIFGWANVTFIASLIIGVISAFLIFVTANVKETAFKREITEANERIEEASARGDEANARAAEANEKAEKAKQGAAEATLKLEELRSTLRPRTLQRDSFFKLLEGKPKAPVEIVYPKDDAEAYELSMQLRDFLRMAEWDVREPSFIPQTDVARFMNAPSAVGAGGQPTGVSLVVRAETQDDFKILGDRTADTPLNALHDALLASLGRLSGAINNDASPARGVIRVVVGPKPHTIQ